MMTGISTLRLYLLRAGYLLLVLGLGSAIWPQILHHPRPWELMHGVVACMLGAMSALAVVGLRYPLQMLPLLFFELAWKTIWLTVVALPAWRAGTMDAATTETAFECLLVVVFVAVVPWDHVFANFVLRPGERYAGASCGPRTSRPGRAPVVSPKRLTTWPETTRAS